VTCHVVTNHIIHVRNPRQDASCLPAAPLATPIDDTELARRAIANFGEMVAALGRGGADGAAEVRRPDAVGARIPSAAANPWFDCAVVPNDAAPPTDNDPLLPHCLWTRGAAAVPGRAEEPTLATPCMGIALDDSVLDIAGSGGGYGSGGVEEVPLAVLGELNERAYGDLTGTFPALVASLHSDPRARAHGLRNDAGGGGGGGGGAFVCVALTLAVGDDVGVHYVATEAGHRRRGLATRLLRAVLSEARAGGMRTATLQARVPRLAACCCKSGVNQV
jgi:GNAT superfamily N-acetyltransferase